jgi:hypothetical protein
MPNFEIAAPNCLGFDRDAVRAVAQADMAVRNVCSGMGGTSVRKYKKELPTWEGRIEACPNAGEMACAQVCQVAQMVNGFAEAVRPPTPPAESA